METIWYCVIYRMGGTENFKWFRTLPVDTKERAQQQCDDVKRMGYHAFVEGYERSVAVGLPETFIYINSYFRGM